MKRTPLAVAGAVLAPPAIKADVDTINKAAQQLLVVTKADGFAVSTVSNRPEFQELTDTMTRAEYEDAQGRFGTSPRRRVGSPPRRGADQ